ncbi:MAG: AAA family ATPase [Planctomycetaceae bacterium]|nr:AAA family ATPase [Planctomycetaceae bacterium]
MIADCQAQVDELYTSLGGSEGHSTSDATAEPPSGTSTCPLTDDELEGRIRQGAYGEKFQRLFEGDTSAYAGNHSNADQALINKLTWVIGRDPDRVDELFRRSGLYREEKWGERVDYRNRTINKTFSSVTEFYNWTPAAEEFRNHAKPCIKFIPAAEFDAGDYRQEYLISNVLVAGQPCIIGGPSKSLKTSIAVALAIALGAGMPFLSYFCVPRRLRVAVLSGESGAATLQETARRIAKSKGIELAETLTFWGFDLPQLSRPDHLEALIVAIREIEADVIIIDPAYLCLLDQGLAESAGNVFRMGNILRELAKVGTETGCTLILCHHTTKAAARGNEPLSLEDMSQSGFAEFARQWLLVNRRKAYEHGTGEHKLWLNVGGSAGHSGLYAIDVDEGNIRDDFTGRYWSVSVRPGQQHRAEEKNQKDAEDLEAIRNLIVAYLKNTPGDSRTGIRQNAGVSSGLFPAAFASLMNDGTIVSQTITKGNRQTYSGFRLAD